MRNFSFVGTFIFCVATLILVGCQRKEFVSSAYEAPKAVSAGQKMPTEPVIVIRLIGGLDENSKNRLSSHYTSNMNFGGKNESGTVDQDALVNSVGKTVYYTLELYRHLTKNYSSARILLQPAKLSIGPDGGAFVKTAYDLPYATVIVDLFTHYDPHTDPESVIRICTTYGNKICPLLSITTSPKVSPGTKGLLAVTYTVAHTIRSRASEGALAGLGADIAAILDSAPNLNGDLPSFLDDKTTQSLPVPSDKVYLFPAGPFFVGEVGRKLYQGEISESDAIYMFDESTEWTMRPYVNVISDVVANLGVSGPITDTFVPYVRVYDNALADHLSSGAVLSKEERDKLKLVQKFASVEFRALQKEGERLLASLDSNGWHDHMVRFLAAERKASGRLLADRGMQHAGAAMAGMGSMMAARSGSPGAAAFGVVAAAAGVGLAIKSGASGAALKDFSRFFAGTIDEQAKFAIETVNNVESIEASKISDMRSRMKEIFEREFGGQ